jgi:starch phosphorylase
MKLMMNGAVTLGTEDGANVEIHKSVGDDNIIIFGMETPEVNRLKKVGYSPAQYYNNNPVIRNVLDFLSNGLGNDFKNVTEHIKNNDTYMALADFADYTRAQNKVSELYADKEVWSRMSLMNIASSGIFASDRSIEDYAKNIWNTKPLK